MGVITIQTSSPNPRAITKGTHSSHKMCIRDRIGHVDPDLLSPPGLQLEPEQGKGTVLPQGLIVSTGVFPVRPDRLFHQRSLTRPQRSVNGAGGRGGCSDADSQIGSLKVGRVKLTLQHLQMCIRDRYNASLLLAHKIARYFGLTIEEVFLFEEEST